MHCATCAAIGLAMLGAATTGFAQVTIDDPWVRGTVTGMRSTGAFMRITSASQTRLVGASSAASRIVEIHQMTTVDNVMRMRAVDAVPVAPGRPLELRPGGYHMMLVDLTGPLEKGATIPITLTFEGKDGKREQVAVQAQVRPVTAEAKKSGREGAHESHRAMGHPR
ncbi:MAG: copper chaperone PCu(A)C [Proteobacteria bacterium]|nr:copper chaperone PCu(A)C [Burkholderiales bacterium]